MVKYEPASLTPPEAGLREGREPLAIEQARCLPLPSRPKLFVLNKMISEFWNVSKKLVTKGYDVSRVDLRGKCRFGTPREPFAAAGRRCLRVCVRLGFYLGLKARLVRLTVPPSVAWNVRRTCW